MSDVSGVSRNRRTEEMMDDLAHDAGIAPGGEHVHSGALQESAAHAWATRHDKALPDAKTIAKEGAAKAVEHATEHALEHGWIAGGGAAAASMVIAGSALTLKFLIEEAWLKPHLEGDHMRELQANDALNVGVADTLAMPPGFRASVRGDRPGVEKGAEKVRVALQGRDAAMVPVLQARADEGFLAMKLVFADASHLPQEQREKAIAAGLATLQDRAAHDVAFGLGMKLFVWSESQDGATRTKIDQDVESRVAPRPFYTQG